VITAVKSHRAIDLLELIDADGLPGFLPCWSTDGESECSEERNDSDNDEEFDKGETLPTSQLHIGALLGAIDGADRRDRE
jgi:hypothetical protein